MTDENEVTSSGEHYKVYCIIAADGNLLLHTMSMTKHGAWLKLVAVGDLESQIYNKLARTYRWPTMGPTADAHGRIKILKDAGYYLVSLNITVGPTVEEREAEEGLE